MISRTQLLDLGVASSSVTQAAALGRLHRVHLAVYSVAPPGSRPRLAPEHAALLACDPGSVISHRSAAWLHGLIDCQPATVDVSVTGARGRRLQGIVVHRVTGNLPGDRTLVGRLPCTSLARTVIDLSARLDDPQLEPLLDRTLRRTSTAALLLALDRAQGRPGTRRLRALLHPNRPSADAWSQAERRLLDLIRSSGLPQPECNVTLGDLGYRPDLLWRDQRVIVEYDSWQFHSGPASFHGDRARHNELTAQGFQVLHVTWRALRDHPERVLVWIGRALGRR